MFKRILIPILLLFLSSCGYEAIHSKKNFIYYDFSINNLTFIGDRIINIKYNNGRKKTKYLAIGSN